MVTSIDAASVSLAFDFFCALYGDVKLPGIGFSIHRVENPMTGNFLAIFYLLELAGAEMAHAVQYGPPQ